MKNFKVKRFFNSSGITLIALVITIVVLLILAGVSISTLTGDNGLLTKVGEAKTKTEEAEENEKRQLAALSGSTNINGTTYTDKKGTTVKIPAGFAPTGIEGESTVDEGLIIVDGSGNEYVWIEVPKTGTESDKGIKWVDYSEVEDEEEDSAGYYTAIANALRTYVSDSGVITVGDRLGSAKTTTRGWKDEWYDSASHIYDGEKWCAFNGGSASSYNGNLDDKDGCGLTYEQYTTLYNKMLESVYTNGGFWIGRYEAGITSPRGNKNDSIDGLVPLSKQNQYSINYVTCSQAQTIASRATSTGTYNSSLMFGIQWDLVLKFIYEKEITTNSNIKSELIDDSSTWGNYYNQPFTIDRGKYSYADSWNNFIPYTKAIDNKVSVVNGISKKIGTIQDNKILLTTGASDTNKKKNIYDLAGNVREWTLEHATLYGGSPCTERGGSFNCIGSNDPGSTRYSYSTTSSFSADRFSCFNILSLERCSVESVRNFV